MNCVTSEADQERSELSVLDCTRVTKRAESTYTYRREVRGRDCTTTIIYDTPTVRLEDVTMETLDAP